MKNSILILVSLILCVFVMNYAECKSDSNDDEDVVYEISEADGNLNTI